MSKQGRKTCSEYVREALAKGLTDTKDIQKYCRQRGHDASESCISLMRSGKRAGKIAIPYSAFRAEKHAATLSRALGQLREWVADDETFLALLRKEIKVIKGVQSPTTGVSA